MSKKQQEFLDAQIANEKKIRQEMLQLDSLVNKSTSILIRAIHAQPSQVKSKLAVVIRTFSRLLRSPIATGYVLKAMKEITRRLFGVGDGHPVIISFYDSIVYCLLRLVDAPIQIEPEWKQEPVEKSLKRIITGLKAEFNRDYDDFDLDLAKLAFIYPFLKVIKKHYIIIYGSLK